MAYSSTTARVPHSCSPANQSDAAVTGTQDAANTTEHAEKAYNKAAPAQGPPAFTTLSEGTHRRVQLTVSVRGP